MSSLLTSLSPRLFGRIGAERRALLADNLVLAAGILAALLLTQTEQGLSVLALSQGPAEYLAGMVR